MLQAHTIVISVQDEQIYLPCLLLLVYLTLMDTLTVPVLEFISQCIIAAVARMAVSLPQPGHQPDAEEA
jgi:hypothetical protein